jgi:hypothetical protein
VVKIGKALRDADGASFEYQQIEQELQTLKRTLEVLQALQPNAQNAAHVNVIRCTALSCQWPLADFLRKIGKYERNLGSYAKRNTIKSAGRKTKWALQMSEEVQKFRAMIIGKISSLNLLLSMQNMSVIPASAKTNAEEVAGSRCAESRRRQVRRCQLC